MPRSLVVKVTCGAEDAERANQALTVAASAVAMGADVEVWFTGDGAWFGVRDKCPDLGLAGATPAAELVASVMAGGGHLTVCSQCAARREIAQADLISGATIKGAATFAAQVLEPDVQALVY